MLILSAGEKHPFERVLWQTGLQYNEESVCKYHHPPHTHTHIWSVLKLCFELVKFCCICVCIPIEKELRLNLTSGIGANIALNVAGPIR